MRGSVTDHFEAAKIKQRFWTLDAMRGVAAISIVISHTGMDFHGLMPRFPGMTVDLFFMLSGFVLAFNYDAKFRSGMLPGVFLSRRIKRLYPLFLLGIAVGVISRFYTWRSPMNPLEFAGSVGLSFFALPTPPIGIDPILFPVNVVFWSLFFEFWVANTIYAFFWRQLHGRNLALLIALCALGLIVSERAFYTLDSGADWRTFLVGFARVGFGFFTGVAISRLRATARRNVVAPSWLCLLMLVATIYLPLENRPAHLFELGAIFFILPTLIYLGAGAKERNPRIGAALGDASYAICVTHIPLSDIFYWAREHLPPVHTWFSTRWHVMVYQAGLISFVFVMAWCLDRWVDRPVRKRFAAAGLPVLWMRRPIAAPGGPTAGTRL
ncbi:MAG: acyltransferase [Caulobacteraceae bacterium]